MTQWEAWTVTALGMAVVFVGLVACIAFVHLIGRAARHVRWDGAAHGHGAPTPAAPAPSPAPEPPPSEPVPADVLAVLAAVLEVERKLYLNRPGSRVTIVRPARPH